MNSISPKQFINSLHSQRYSLKDLQHLLQSKHQHLNQIFQAIRLHPYYQVVAQSIIKDIVSNVYKIISQGLEIHIISNLWKEDFLCLITKEGVKHERIKGQLNITNNITKSFQDILMFLCQKMRSLNFNIRINALQSFYQLIANVNQIYNPINTSHKYNLSLSQAQSFDKILNRMTRMMIRKQQLGKIVSFSQGIFLQFLQDQYQQIRVLTLKILEILTIETPYFFTTIQNSKQNIQQSVKQAILYMLNDEHELVRQCSLQIITNINHNQRKQINRKELFQTLSFQEISTILMCLKQSHQQLRQQVYQCLGSLILIQTTQLIQILNKLYQVLLVYKQDKNKIYNLLKKYSLKHQFLIEMLIKQQKLELLYEFNNEQQPNCRNIIYKGKIILLRQTIINHLKHTKLRLIWPSYIVRHISYVFDFEYKLETNRQLTYLVQNVLQKNTENEKVEGRSNTQQIINNLNSLSQIISLQLNSSVNDTFKHDFIKILHQIVCFNHQLLDSKKYNEQIFDMQIDHRFSASNQFQTFSLNIANKIAELNFLYNLQFKYGLQQNYYVQLCLQIVKMISKTKFMQDFFTSISFAQKFIHQILSLLKFMRKNKKFLSQFRRNQFRIKSLVAGKSSIKYLLAIVDIKHRCQITKNVLFKPLNVWIKLSISKNSIRDRNKDNGSKQKGIIYIKLQELMTLSKRGIEHKQSRNNQNYKIKIPLRISDSKLFAYPQKQLKSPHINLNSKMIQEINYSQYLRLITQQIIVNDVYLVYVNQLAIQNNRKQKVLAEWHQYDYLNTNNNYITL